MTRIGDDEVEGRQVCGGAFLTESLQHGPAPAREPPSARGYPREHSRARDQEGRRHPGGSRETRCREQEGCRNRCPASDARYCSRSSAEGPARWRELESWGRTCGREDTLVVHGRRPRRQDDESRRGCCSEPVGCPAAARRPGAAPPRAAADTDACRPEPDSRIRGAVAAGHRSRAPTAGAELMMALARPNVLRSRSRLAAANHAQ